MAANSMPKPPTLSSLRSQLSKVHHISTYSPFLHGQSHMSRFTRNLKCTSRASVLPLIRAQAFPEYVPDAKFYKVEAILRPWRIPQVSSALLKMGIRGVTVSDVRGFGAQGGSAERQAGSEFSEDKFLAKVKVEIVVSKDQVEAVIDKIIDEARTGEIGDGKIFWTCQFSIHLSRLKTRKWLKNMSFQFSTHFIREKFLIFVSYKDSVDANLRCNKSPHRCAWRAG